MGPGGSVVRKFFGCDEPASVPVFQMTCSACNGHGDGVCEKCGGGGYEVLFRCPASQSSAFGAQAVNAYQDWENGILPSAGGASDQAALFGDAMHVVKCERSKIQEALSTSKAKSGI